MTRRRVIRSLAGATGLSVLAACGAPVPAPPPPPTPFAPTVAATIAPTSAASPPSTTAARAPITPTTPPALPATLVPTVPTAMPLATAAPATAAPPTPTVEPASQLRPPFFDTHVHYSEDAWAVIPVERALALMDQAGTRLALVSSTPDAGTIRLHAAAPTRIIPVLRPYRTRDDIGTWHRDRSLPDYLEERLTLGVHRGIGEFHLNGDDATSPVVAQIARLATTRQLLLHAHSDERAVTHLFAIEPGVRVLWAHAGFAGPAAVRAMVERYPNLWVEFAFRSDVAAGGQLDTAWRSLIEQFPDRFMIGTDSYVVPRWAAMPAILGEVRAWCATLPPTLRDNLAWRNAARLLGVDETIFRT